MQLIHILLKIVQQETRLRAYYSAELRTSKQALITSKHSIEFNYYDFTCHLKVNRDKLRLINNRWKCKKGPDLRLPLVHSSRKSTDTQISLHAVSSRYRERGHRQEIKIGNPLVTVPFSGKMTFLYSR